jgi:hypothetical protein
MKKLFAAVTAFAALAATPALAQQQAPRKLQVAPFVGAYVATGDQRDLLDDGLFGGLTASYDVHPYAAVIGSFGWAPTQAKGLARDEDLDIFQYDVGVQGQFPFDTGNGVTLKPFAGIGVGARTYSFRDLDVDTETDFAGIVALGGSVEYRAFAVSVTARDYLTSFDGIGPEGDASTRNDLGLFASVAMRF